VFPLIAYTATSRGGKQLLENQLLRRAPFSILFWKMAGWLALAAFSKGWPRAEGARRKFRFIVLVSGEM